MTAPIADDCMRCGHPVGYQGDGWCCEQCLLAGYDIVIGEMRVNIVTSSPNYRGPLSKSWRDAEARAGKE